MDRCTLRLFVTGQSPRSERAIKNVQEICRQDLRGEADLEIIDVLDRPDHAERDLVIATPTLIRVFPTPVRRIIGDLSDRDRVLSILNIEPAE